MGLQRVIGAVQNPWTIRVEGSEELYIHYVEALWVMWSSHNYQDIQENVKSAKAGEDIMTLIRYPIALTSAGSSAASSVAFLINSKSDSIALLVRETKTDDGRIYTLQSKQRVW